MQLRNLSIIIVRYRVLVVAGILLAMSLLIVSSVSATDGDTARNGRLITIHDRGNERVILTHAQTVRDALAAAKIVVDKRDVVEPKLDSELLATDYTVNIYRARPVVVVDGPVRQKIMTAAQTAEGIAAAAHLVLQSEDETQLAMGQDIANDGASTVLTIDRATRFTLRLYGTPTTAYSQASTVGEMLKQKNITLSANDTLSVDTNAPLVSDMEVTIWRNGVQTATVDEMIDFPIRKVLDSDRPVGYKVVQTPGVKGKKSVVYEIMMQNGREVSRKVIQSVMIEEPKEQVEVVGAKPGDGLTKAKGVFQYRDSNGVTHRETYYDLPMNIVMGACGGGAYTVRADGAKVDKDGYVLVAAHLGNYPRCSIVETSLGLGKVYDTGGFVARHPHGFDLATDWTRQDGR